MAESLTDVKVRIASTKKTSQITKAMYMVSSSKVRRSQKTYNNYQEFLSRIGNFVVTVLNNLETDEVHPMLKEREVKTTAYLLLENRLLPTVSSILLMLSYSLR